MATKAMTLRWQKVVPTQHGIYLRRDPVSSQHVIQDVIEVEGQLLTIDGSGELIPMATWGEAKTFWWFGPIPPSPGE